ncbi:MAG: hypothetical protein QME12_03815 [Nanoarchaeota archaeon]|nr:hypothetical protein [Nanoarchaeota archaeon]
MAPIEKELKEMDGQKSFLFIMDAGKLQPNLVALRVIEKKGVEVYPEQEVYASMVEKKGE